MDAFAVAIVAGLSHGRASPRRVFRLAFHFGLFQALMPVLGWSVGYAVHSRVARIDHWIAFALLLAVGVHLAWSAATTRPGERHPRMDATRGWSLVLLSVATSVDALAVGLSLAMLGATIVVPALVIGVVAAAFTAAGMMLGERLGILWGRRAEVLGGLALIAIGVKILLDHLRA
ncbi:MAG TPA: manganese efflux pump MntP family protein [Terriglobales bacterium]|nr:manganese efflux pump MntP family protein [Terriglobales bacterium]